MRKKYRKILNKHNKSRFLFHIILILKGYKQNRPCSLNIIAHHLSHMNLEHGHLINADSEFQIYLSVLTHHYFWFFFLHLNCQNATLRKFFETSDSYFIEETWSSLLHNCKTFSVLGLE